MSSSPQIPDISGPGLLSVLLIGPDQQRRRAVADALLGCPVGLIRESDYPTDLDDLPRMIDQQCDVVIVRPRQRSRIRPGRGGRVSTPSARLRSSSVPPRPISNSRSAACAQVPANSSPCRSTRPPSPMRWPGSRFADRPATQAEEPPASCLCSSAQKVVAGSPPSPPTLLYRWPRSRARPPC